MFTPKVSVLMSVYNGECFLREAIESILNQTFSDFEFLIFDDGSTDGVPKILETYASMDQRIRIIRNKRNIGAVASYNAGLDLAQGELIARQDADDISEPERLTCQVEFLQKNRDYVLIGSRTLLINDKGKTLARNVLPCNHEALRRYMMKGNPFVHGTMMFYRNQGYIYDPRVPITEDYDIAVQAARCGRLANLPDYLYRYRIHDHSASTQRSLEMEKGKEIVAQRYFQQISNNPTEFFFRCYIEDQIQEPLKAAVMNIFKKIASEPQQLARVRPRCANELRYAIAPGMRALRYFPLCVKFAGLGSSQVWLTRMLTKAIIGRLKKPITR